MRLNKFDAYKTLFYILNKKILLKAAIKRNNIVHSKVLHNLYSFELINLNNQLLIEINWHN